MSGARWGVFLNNMIKFFNYVKESFAEVRHIKWPTKQETLLYTVAVIAISAGVAYYLNLFDTIFTRALDLIV